MALSAGRIDVQPVADGVRDLGSRSASASGLPAVQQRRPGDCAGHTQRTAQLTSSVGRLCRLLASMQALLAGELATAHIIVRASCIALTHLFEEVVVLQHLLARALWQVNHTYKQQGRWDQGSGEHSVCAASAEMRAASLAEGCVTRLATVSGSCSR